MAISTARGGGRKAQSQKGLVRPNHALALEQQHAWERSFAQNGFTLSLFLLELLGLQPMQTECVCVGERVTEL